MGKVDLDRLNDEQRAIATTLDEPLFVAAGAGSGKTFTLTQRIAWALAPGSGEDGRPYLDDISQVLVITFTNVAAREIKERVRSTLRASGMNDQALKVDGAWISTIHGMCKRILSRHALDLGLDPDFRVAAGNEASACFEQALEDVLGEASKKRGSDPALKGLFDTFDLGHRNTISGPTGIYEKVTEIRNAAIASPGGFDSLTVPPAADTAELMDDLARCVGALSGRKLSESAQAAVQQSMEALDAFVQLAPGERTPEAALAAVASVKLPRKSKPIEDVLPDAKEALAAAKTELPLAAARPAMEKLVELARKVDERYAELKRERSILDNDDLIERACEAMESSEAVRKDYEGRFRLVMVDEFQDTDQKQLRLISLLAGEGACHLATVGDAQQSIYRFRGADVSVFHGRGKELADGSHVELAVNYRSHKDILSFVDAVCGGEDGVLDDFMHLDPAPVHTKTFDAEGMPRIDLEIVQAISGAKKEAWTAVGAHAIARRFREMADAGASAGDMVLLLGTTSRIGLYIDAIRQEGLSCVVTGGSGFTETDEAKTMQALLHYLANERDTETGLFPLLASPLFSLDAGDFVQLATTADEEDGQTKKRRIDRGFQTMEFCGDAEVSARLRRAQAILRSARLMVRRRPVADVCSFVVERSGWLDRLALEGAEGEARAANVLAVLRYVRDLCEDMSLGAARAAEEFDRWLDISKLPPASLSGGGKGSVRIMTIHASKGAQFKIVGVAECWSDPRSGALACGTVGDEASRTLIVPPTGMKAEEGLLSCDVLETMGERYICLRAQEKAAEAAEKTRLLYVALTRAEEAIVLGINLSQTQKGMAPSLAAGVVRALFGDALPQPGASTLDFGGEEPALVHVTCVTKEKPKGAPEIVRADSGGVYPELDGVLPDDARTVARGGAQAQETERTYRFFEQGDAGFDEAVGVVSGRSGIFSYSSAHEAMGKEAEMPDFGDEAGADAAIVGAEVSGEGHEDALAASDTDRSTRLGSAFHLLAQGMAETGREPSEEAIQAEVRLWKLDADAEARLRQAIARWAGSALRREALACGSLRPEVPFFLEAHSGLGSYVEGAIDLLAWNDRSRALLVDYKTGDFGLSADEIRRRHWLQADLYASALRAMGFEEAECCFVCVELEDPDDPAQPFVVRYRYGKDHEAHMW